MKYYQLIKLLKRKNKEIDELQKEIKDLRNFGLLSLTFNVGFVMSVFVSLMWGSYIAK
jgi:hypothetical protein